jgi:hypothetical protein
MAITLRTEKGTALTYAEMDKNFSSFFYSASVDYSTDQLQLWYTGSVDLSTPGESFNPGRVINIPLNPSNNAVTALTVAGGPGEIQFRDYNNSILAASSNFIYSSTGNLGIGTPSPATRLHVKGSNSTPATLRLQSNNGDNLAKKSTIEFYEGTTLRGEIGRLSITNNDIYINTAPGGNLKFKVQDDPNTGAWTTTGLGIGTITPEKKLHVVGEGFITTGLGIGVGAQNHAIYAFSDIGPATPQKSFKSFARFANFGGPNGGSVNGLNMITYRQEVGEDWTSTGTRIQQLVDATYMGYVQFSGPDNLHGISIGTGNSKEDAFGVIHEPGHPDIQERLRVTAAGNVGINTTTPTEKLTVEGNISGSGFVKVNGTATVGTIAAGSAATTSAVVATSAGLLQKIDAAPIPKGGIILWSGATGAIPAGWRLCDGGTINGMTTPNLQDRFVVGAGSTYDVDADGGSADAVVVAHTHTATSIDSGHTHNWGYGTEQDDSGTGGSNREFTTTAATNNPVVPTPVLSSSANITTTVNSEGESGTNKNLPPYYALAYIMYGGI